MKEFKGKVAVITGAASGIGLALARKFAAEGMKVVLADYNATALQEAVEGIRATGADAIGVRTDVSLEQDVQALAKQAVDAFENVHILCNNAGVCKGGVSWQSPIKDYEWVLGVNLYGVIFGIRAFMPILEKNEEGHIVNTSSQSGITTTPYSAEYCASKHAVLALSEVLYKELLLSGSPIRVSVLCPDSVVTNIYDSDKNRPERFHADPGKDRDVQQFVKSALTEEVQRGILPAEMAERAFEAIKNEQFYILPERGKWRHLIDLRLEDIRLGRNPTIEF
jgi:NAD(P)-dependent dehydrogenase (short-subunit alcohol dehydrogenase family)